MSDPGLPAEAPCCPGVPETWQPVPGWPHYASDHGRIATKRGRILKQKPSNRPKDGPPFYQLVTLCANGEGKTFTVHSLVLRAHRGERPAGQESRHGDDVPDHNHLVNLQWGTADQNAADKARQPRYRTAEKAELRRAGARVTNARRKARRDRDVADLVAGSPAWRLAYGDIRSRSPVRRWLRFVTGNRLWSRKRPGHGPVTKGGHL